MLADNITLNFNITFTQTLQMSDTQEHIFKFDHTKTQMVSDGT